jgi:NAD(P)-dependent dehydrogenase (short-subunit alcohol dehydrogenase family)
MGKPVFDDLQTEPAGRKYSAMKAYGNAKLFNIYFTKSLAEKYKSKGITAFAVHPGLVKTSFGTGLNGFAQLLMWLAKPFMISAQQGAQTSIYLATQPKMDANSGQYFKNQKVAKPAAIAGNEAARNQLWAISKQLVSAFL